MQLRTTRLLVPWQKENKVCVIKYMEPLIGYKQYQRWSDFIMSPGSVGSVGDVLPTSFLKTSCTDLPRRVDATFAGAFALPLGSVVQNGTDPDFLTGGLGARTIDSNWDLPRRRVPIAQGWRYQNMDPPDMLVEPLVASLGDFSWRHKLAKVQDRVTGFEQVPGEYSSSGIPRGGMVPRIVDFAEGDMVSEQLGRQSFLPQKPNTPWMFGYEPKAAAAPVVETTKDETKK